MKSNEKLCICCGSVGDSQTMFGKNAANVDGRSKYCKDCVRVKSRAQEKKRKEYQIAYRENNRERLSTLAADKYRRSTEVIEAANARREAKELAKKLNSELKAKKAEFDKVWSAVTKLRGAAGRKSRKDTRPWVRKDLQSRKPSWVEWDSFKEVYTKARDLTEASGIQYEVDHIYPLRSDWVCGLHTPNNLHVMRMHDNARKRNRPYGPVGDELWNPGHPSTYWPDEDSGVSVSMKASAEALLQYAEEYPAIVGALIDFYRLTGEPEHLHIEWLQKFSDSSTNFTDLLSYRKRQLAPDGLLTSSGTVKRVGYQELVAVKLKPASARKPRPRHYRKARVIQDAVGGCDYPPTTRVQADAQVQDSAILKLLAAQLNAAAAQLNVTPTRLLAALAVQVQQQDA